MRDLVSFLKNDSADAQGHANPLADLKAAACAAGTGCAVAPVTNFDVAIGEGISQSGRFLRDFLYQGFNKDVQRRQGVRRHDADHRRRAPHLGERALRAARSLVQAA